MVVTVYERSDGLNEAGAGIQIPSNASIHLARLGLLSKLRQCALKPHAISTMVQLMSLAVLGYH